MITEKPNIKLLCSPNSGYFYDVNKNEIVSIDTQGYEFLRQIEENADFAETKPQSVSDLEKQGYLSTNRVKNVKHYLTDYVETILERGMRKVALQLTQECNFRCKYCGYTQDNDMQRHHGQKKMTIETAKKAVLFLRDHSVDSDEICVGFYGGEPLLEFGLLKEVAAFSQEQLAGRNIIYTITTNASLLDKEKVDFLAKNNFSVVISLDGIKKINDKNRVFAHNGKGTFDVICANLRYVYENYRDFFSKLLFNIVIDPSNNFDEIVSIFKSEEMFEHANFQSTLIDDTESDASNTFSEDYVSKSAYQQFLGFLSAERYISSTDISPITTQQVGYYYREIGKMFSQNKLNDTCAPSGPCVPGENRTLVTVDGQLIVCERVSEVSEPMIIGTLDTGFNFEKVKTLMNVGALTADECKDCWAFSHCGMCCKLADDSVHGKLSSEVKLKSCQSYRNMALDLFKKIIMLREAKEYYQEVGVK